MSSSIPPHIAQTLADLRARRDYLDQAIDVLSKIWEGDGAAPAEEAPTRPRTPARSKRPVSVHYHNRLADDAILAVLRRHGTPMKPKDVIKQAKLRSSDAKRACARLVVSGQLVRSGATVTARWALPGRPAKEAP